MAVAICSLADLKEYLSIPTVETEDDELLQRLINASGEFIENETGRVFADPGSDAAMSLSLENIDHKGVLHFTSDLLSLTTVTNGDGTTIPDTEYELLPLNATTKRGLRIKNSSEYYWSFDYDDSRIILLGRWAYSAVVPYTIQQAAVRLASYLYRQKDTSDGIDRPILAGDGNIIMPTKLPTDVMRLIDGYRVTHV